LNWDIQQGFSSSPDALRPQRSQQRFPIDDN